MKDSSEPSFSVERYFCDLMVGDKNLSAAIAAMKTLLMVLEETNSEFLHFIILMVINVSNIININCSNDHSRTALGDPKSGSNHPEH